MKGSVYAVFTGFLILTLALVPMRMLASGMGDSAANPPAVVFAVILGIALGVLYFTSRILKGGPGPRAAGLTFFGSALCFLILVTVLPAIHRAYGFVHSLGPASPGALLAVRWVLTAAVLVIPGFLLGGSLAFIAISGGGRSRPGPGRAPGMAFLGMAAGAPALTLLVLPVWGAAGALLLAALLSAAMGGLSLLRGGTGSTESRGGPRPAPRRIYGPGEAAVLLISFSVVTHTFLWLKVLRQVMGAGAYTFLACALVLFLGLAAGCLGLSRLMSSSGRGGFYTGILAALTAVYGLVVCRMADGLPLRFLAATGSGSASTGGFFLAYLGFAALTLLLPASLLGTCLGAEPGPAGGGAGAANSALRPGRLLLPAAWGAVLALLLARPVFSSGLGLEAGVMTAAWICLAGALLLKASARPAPGLLAAAAAPGLIVCIALTSARTPWNRSAITSGVYTAPEFYGRMEDPGPALSSGDVPYYAEDPEGVVAVVRTPDGTFLKLDGRVVGAASEGIVADIMAAHIPMLLHPDPRNVLLLGLGTGVTLGSIHRYEVESVTAVEPVEAVIDAAPFFSFYTYNSLEDRRNTISRMNPREFMRLTGEKYDVVITRAGAYSDAVHASDLTLEYLLLARSVLSYDGVLCYSLDPTGLSRECLMSSVNGFLAAFPYAQAWYAGYSRILLIGSLEPLRLSEQAMAARLERPWVRSDLKRLQINSEAGVLANFMLNREALRSYLGAFTLLSRDSKPRTGCSGAPVPAPGAAIAGLGDLNRFRLNPANVLTDYEKDSVEQKIARDRYDRCADAGNYYLGSYSALVSGDQQEAAKRLEYAISLCSANGLLKERLSFLYIYVSRDLAAAGRFEEAVNVARRAIEVSPVSYLAFYNLAGLERMRDPATAVALLERLRQINPDFLPADLMRAEALLAAGMVEEAGGAVSEVLSREPLNRRAHHIRALCFVERGLTEAARVELEYVLEADPDNGEALAALGYTWLLAGDIGKAEEYYSRAFEIEPGDPGVLNNYATVLAEKGEYREAIRLWQKALSMDPGNQGIRANIQEATEKMNQD